MIRRSSSGRAVSRRPVFRVLALILAVAFLATACGGAGPEPSLTADRPELPPVTTALPAPGSLAVDAARGSSSTTVVPLSETTEPTVLVTVPPVKDEFGLDILPPVLEDVPLPDEMRNPDLTVLSAADLPPPPPPLPLPVLAPAWEPTTILIAKEDVNRIIPVYDARGGTRLAFPDGDVWSYTFEGNRLVVRLTQGSQGDEWVEVELGVRPNGATGWVRAEDFNWTTVNHHIHIDVSDRSVALYDGDALVVSTRAIVGKPATPTPTLRGFISEKLPNHSQQNGSIVYGEWILFLSFYSEVLNSFGGGLPVIALHGTHIPERVGEALSNGCIRIPNDIIEAVARTAPLGTVVNVAA